jgi:hypothetical protein
MQHASHLYRRAFLRLGGSLPWFAGGGFLGGSLRAMEAKPQLQCILLWLDGGPSHLEMWDPKMDAPQEVRGPFGSVPTAIAGIHFSEGLERCAQRADRMTIIRSMTSPLGEHGLANRYALTGYLPSPSIEYPSLGSIVANAHREQGRTLPHYISLPQSGLGMGAGFLGLESEPFVVSGDPSKPDFRVRDLTFYPGLNAQRLHRRRDLLSLLESQNSIQSNPLRAIIEIEKNGTPLDRAFQMTLSPSALNAFDLSKEQNDVKDRYGPRSFGQCCLLARRLIQHEVPFVTVVQPGWDTHENLKLALRDGYSGAKVGVGLIPTFDQAVAALIDELDEIGRLETTMVIAMGEFGRTPKLNPRGGRDHWPRVFSVMLCGGGLPKGLVLGASDRIGESPKDRPITPSDLARTVIERLGVAPETPLRTPDGRTIPVNQNGTSIRELL